MMGKGAVWGIGPSKMCLQTAPGAAGIRPVLHSARPVLHSISAAASKQAPGSKKPKKQRRELSTGESAVPCGCRRASTAFSACALH